VLEGVQLALGGQGLEGLLFPDALIAVDQVDHGRLKHEEATVDPGVVAVGLLLEIGDPIAVEVQGAVSAGGAGRR